MTKKETGAKGATLTIASAMVVFGMQLVLSGDLLTGAAGLVISVILFTAYVVFDEKGKSEEVDELVQLIGEDTLKALANASADQLERLLKEAEFYDETENRK